MVTTRGKTKPDKTSSDQSSETTQLLKKSGTSGKSSSSSSSSGSNSNIKVSGLPLKTWHLNISLGATGAILVLSSLSYLSYDGYLNFLSGSVNPDKLTGYGLKSEYVFRYLILGLTFTVVNIAAVGFKRLLSPQALDPLNHHEDLIQSVRNILSNSIEQLLVSVVTQLCLVSYLNGIQVARIIPLMNMSFLLGRITFALGYPKYRTFGFTLSFLPVLISVPYILYRFLSSQLGLF